MRCCAKFPSINLPDQEIDDQYTDTRTSIHFQIYHIIECCSTHGKLPLTDNKMCRECKQDSVSEQYTKYIHYKRASDDGYNHLEYSYKFLYSINS